MKTVTGCAFVRLVITGLRILPLVGLVATLLNSGPANANAPVSREQCLDTPALNLPLQPSAPKEFKASTSNRQSGLGALPFRSTFRINRNDPALALRRTGAQKPESVDSNPAVIAPQTASRAPDHSVLGQSGVTFLREDFANFPGGYPQGYELGVPFAAVNGLSDWTIYDSSDDGFYRSWGAVNIGGGDYAIAPGAFGPDALDPFTPSPNGGYSNNLYSWLDYGPMDLRGFTDLYVDFRLWYDTEPDFDQVYFCASVDGQEYNCGDPWSGDSHGWQNPAYWLTSYAGYSTVYLAWIFRSDAVVSGDNGYLGPFIDDVYVRGE